MGHTTSPVFNNVQLGQDSINPPAQNKTMERGANSCPNLNPTWKVQTPLTSDQIDPEKTLVGNIEVNNRGKLCPNLAQQRPITLPNPKTLQDPESATYLQKLRK